jgi:hypothetical protein
MSIECFNASEKFSIISEADENLVMVLNGLLEDTKRTVTEFILLSFSEFGFRQVAFRLV